MGGGEPQLEKWRLRTGALIREREVRRDEGWGGAEVGKEERGRGD